MTATSFRLAFGFALIAATLGLARAAVADPKGWTIGALPRWVSPAAPSSAGAVDAQTAGANGIRYLLYDRQVKVADQRREAYTRLVQQITNESGLQAASQVDVEFDPSYEKLTLHAVVVRRADEAFDRLDRSALRVVQREKNLDAQIYDGRLSVVLFVPDLRVGDVVDYAYTIGGADPTLDGRYADTLLLGAPAPMSRLHVRVLVSRGRPVRFVTMGPDADVVATPVERPDGTETEYVWDRSDVKAFPLEADAPPSYEQLPWVEATEFKDWQEVARLGAKWFEAAGPPRGPLKQWVDTARADATSTEEFLLRATRFVQDQIRYVAVEVGMSRRRPTEPAVVFERRYGDCKDKTALLVAMLRAGGVLARPALVSSTRGRSLDNWAESPLAFDHVIVRVEPKEGHPLWIDPTATLQGGGIERMAFSPFDRALELDPANTKLEKTKREPSDDPSPFVRDEFRVGKPGTDEETMLDSVQVYRGEMADSMRATLRAVAKEQLRKRFLKRYEPEYPAIREVREFGVFDDRDRNYVRVDTHFAIPRFWSRAESTAPFTAAIAARVIDAFLSRPSTSVRSAPLGLLYPLHTRYEVEALLPLEFPGEPEAEQTAVKSFRFDFASHSAHRRLNYSFDLTNLSREVRPADLASHAEAVDKVQHLLLRTLWYRPVPPDGPNWPIIGLLVLAVPVCGWGARRVYRCNPRVRALHEESRWEGIRGWLKLLGIGIFFSPFSCMYEACTLAMLVITRAKWSALTSEASGHSTLLGSVIAAQTVGALAMTAYGGALVAMFLRRRRSFSSAPDGVHRGPRGTGPARGCRSRLRPARQRPIEGVRSNRRQHRLGVRLDRLCLDVPSRGRDVRRVRCD
jgi:transglutaminase-like putative cysteine protease